MLNRGAPASGVFAERGFAIAPPQPKPITIRKEFPESWIWEDVNNR